MPNTGHHMTNKPSEDHYDQHFRCQVFSIESFEEFFDHPILALLAFNFLIQLENEPQLVQNEQVDEWEPRSVLFCVVEIEYVVVWENGDHVYPEF
jgi:hypothetical protein